ncbi:sulfur carrier protein ThiS adenylyltransferase ThiF [Halonatronum saccharophilum]|uniref:sulfur carrier protein ThiS adenylyltransferase ThiF n=1 Tax=Halonatronum saccharophilum TaxID=150060 RepID=UPI0004820A34|nr:sulfur carrier protein ThiS adenylyltransferase ThiF [Halonatronum saccharophilum]
MNSFEKGLESYLGKDRLKKVQSYRIGIGGAGGLGSNVAFNLVRSGFKSFVIVDFDIIEASNLNRQFYFIDQVGKFKVEALKENLLRINPDLDLKVIRKEVNKENMEYFFSDCDILVEAFDKVKSKKLMVERYMNSDKLLVSASGIGGWGNSDDLSVKKINDTFYLVGDLVSEVSKERPPISPRVNICAAKQGNIILKLVLEDYYG